MMSIAGGRFFGPAACLIFALPATVTPPADFTL
jgi:hypothetical protein